MKKKPTKKQPLVFTPEIRAYFREREIKRIERYKKEIEELRQTIGNQKYQIESLTNRYYNLRAELKKLLE